MIELFYVLPKTKEKLTRELSLRKVDIFCQDWEIEVADVEQLDEYIEYYKSNELSVNEKTTLMFIILEAYDCYLYRGKAEDKYKESLKKLLRRDYFIQIENIDYWSCKGSDLDDCFGVTPLIRDIIGGQNALENILLHLKSTYQLLKKTFQKDMSECDYWAVLSLLYNHLSDENLALVMACFVDKKYGELINDVYKASQLEIQENVLMGVKTKLEKNGFGVWKFIEQMLEFFPVTISAYYEHIEEYGEVLPTVVIEDVFMSEIIKLLDKEPDAKMLKQVFEYFEKVSNSGDVHLLNVFSVTVLESLGNDKEILENAKKYMGPKTTELQIEADGALGRK